MTTTPIGATGLDQHGDAISDELTGLPALRGIIFTDGFPSKLWAGIRRHGESFLGLIEAIAAGAIPSGPDDLEGLWQRFYIDTFADRTGAFGVLLEQFGYLPPYDEIFGAIDPEWHGLLILDEARAAAELKDRVFLVDGEMGIHAFHRYPAKADNE